MEKQSEKIDARIVQIKQKNIITNDGDLYYAKKNVGEDTSGDFPSKHLRLGILGEKSIVDDPDPFGDGSCLATYPFDEDINDLTGNRNLTLKQGTTTYSSAHFDNGLEFDGNTYLQRNEAIFGSDGEQGTISVWVYVGENNAGNYVFQTAPDNDTAKISITSGTDSVAFLMRENGYGTQKAISKDELAQGFHHVVGIFDSTSFSFSASPSINFVPLRYFANSPSVFIKEILLSAYRSVRFSINSLGKPFSFNCE